MPVDFDALALAPAFKAFANVDFAYTPPTVGGTAATGTGIFDRHANTLRMEGDSAVSVRQPRLGVRLADFAADEPREMGLIVLTWREGRAGVAAGAPAGRWRISGVDPDGEGGALLSLSALSGAVAG